MITERLRDIREDALLTQKDMACLLGVSQSNYSRWENGIEIIPLAKLNIVCNKFHVSMDYVCGFTSVNIPNKNLDLDEKLIGKNLRSLRKANHITQSDLAKKLNTTQSTIAAYELGKTRILTIFAFEIVKLFNVSLDELCGKR